MSFLALLLTFAIYILSIGLIALLAFFPVSIFMFVTGGREKAAAIERRMRIAHLKQAIANFMKKQGEGGFVCGCTAGRRHKKCVYLHFKTPKKEWSFATAGSDLSSAILRMEHKLSQPLRSMENAGRRRCPRLMHCPKEAKPANLENFLSWSGPPESEPVRNLPG